MSESVCDGMGAEREPYIYKGRKCKPVGRVCHVPRESESGFMVLLFCLGETKSSLEPLIKSR